MKKALEEVYVLYMNNDTTGLLSDDFDYMIDDMKEQGKIVENTNELEEKDDLINLVGNIAGQVENLERENANGEKFKVSNFSIVSKDTEPASKPPRPSRRRARPFPNPTNRDDRKR